MRTQSFKTRNNRRRDTRAKVERNLERDLERKLYRLDPQNREAVGGANGLRWFGTDCNFKVVSTL